MSQNKRGKYTRIFNFPVRTTVQQLVANDPRRTGLLVYNNGSAAIYLLSAQTQTVSDGIPIQSGSSYSDETGTAALWVVAASGTQDARVQVNGD